MTTRYQKRHYEDVARLLRERSEHIFDEPLVRQVIEIDFADLFAADNPDFDRERFLAACGLESEE